MRIRPIVSVVAVVLIVGVLVGTVGGFAQAVIPAAPTTPTPSPTQVVPAYLPPTPFPTGQLSDQQQRTELLATRKNLCTDLQLIAGIILNTGTLNDVPARIQQLTGMKINELEALETNSCQEPVPSGITTSQLRAQVQTIEWLNRVHLAALRDVTAAQLRTQPSTATGSFAAFLDIHQIIISEMRADVAALAGPNATVADARRLGTFWTDVLVPHARAEETDTGLFPLARSVNDPAINQSVSLLSSEHKQIDDGIAKYQQTLQQVEQGRAPLTDLVPIAQDIRGRVELHFGKEEQSVIRPLRGRLTDAQFRPAVDNQVRAIGPWLRAHGWKDLPPSP